MKPFICTMPMRLDEGWNQIQFNLSDFTRRAYGTNYIETLRVQIHANCRIRRIYFSDRLYSEEELPPEFKLYLPLNVRKLVLVGGYFCFVLLFEGNRLAIGPLIIREFITFNASNSFISYPSLTIFVNSL